MVVSDESRVDELLDAIRKLQTGEVHVGILGDNGSDILMVAHVQEFGANIAVTDKMRGYLSSQGLHLKKSTKEIKVPERSFIRGSFDENRKKLENTIDQMLIDVVELKASPDDVFHTLGNYCVGVIVEYMTDLISHSNHPFTIAKKGSSNPLIDTGRLRDSIDYEIKYK